MHNLFGPNASKRATHFFDIDLTALTVKVERHHFLSLIFQGGSRVSKCALENMHKLLDDAREAHRLLRNRDRRTNDYRVLNLRSISNSQ